MAASSLIAFADAQVKTPQSSAPAEVEVIVGLTKIEVEYARPNKSGRTIFGDLVPYGKLWRTGANKNTTIEFKDDVLVNGQALKAGKYAIYTKPEKNNWDIYFYTDTDNWGLPQNWDDAKVAAKINVKAHKIPMTVETFSIHLDDLTYNSAKLNFLWDNVYVEAKIEVPTDQKVLSSIEKTMKENPTAQDFMSAANYYYTTGKDIQQAKKWMDEGMKMIEKPAFYQLHQQALIHAKAGDKKSAAQLANQSMSASKAAGSDDYVKLNENLLKSLK